MSSNIISVALTGFDGLDEAGPGVSIARALRAGWSNGLHLTALGQANAMTGAWLPGLFDRLALSTPPNAGDEAVLEGLLQAQNGRPFAAVIPGGAREMQQIARLSNRLAELGTLTLLPTPDRVEVLQPSKLPRFLYDNHIIGPLTTIVTDLADVPRQADQMGYPLYVKAAGQVPKLVFSAGQAAWAAAHVRSQSQSDPAIVLQRQAAGDHYAVATVAGRNGDCAGMVIMRHLASNPTGRPACGAVVDDPEIEAFARKFLQAAHWRGPLEIEVVRSSGSGELCLTDLQFHLPSWSMLCHWAGANLAVELLREILGEGRHSAADRPRAGTMFVRGIAETSVPLEELLRLKRHGRIDGPSQLNGKGAHGHALDKTDGIRVAVTGTGTLDVVNPGLGVARALRKATGIAKTYGLSYGTFDSGAYQSELFDSSFHLPSTKSGEVLLDRLRQIHESRPFDVLVPCLDGELPRFIDIREQLRDIGIHTLLPSRDSFERRSKLKLFGGDTPTEWGGFAIPESRIAKSEAKTSAAVSAVGYPAVVKGPISQCIRVADKEDAKWAWLKLRATGAKAVIVQPNIAGQIYAVSTVCDQNHNTLSSVTIKKLAICERGSTWSAVRVEQPALEAAFANFLRSIEWVGPAEGEFILDEMTDRFYLIEVNPRFTAWISYSAALGANQPYIAARAALGERFEPAEDNETRVFMRASDEVRLLPSQFAALSTKGILHHG